MKNLIRIAVFFLVAGCGLRVAEKASSSNRNAYVVLISFDGFRNDYVEKYDLPNFKKFIEEGVAAEYMIPSFPTKTFPNHYTIVTGLYPDNHGLVDNSFYDLDSQWIYRIGDRERVENAYFYGGLPLWQLCKKQGLKSASYFWVGSEAPVQGMYPDYFRNYDRGIPNEDRIRTVIDWLLLPESRRPNLITLYFSLVDSEGHISGPNSDSIQATLLEADRLLGLMMHKLDSIALPVDVIVTSDHGMIEITRSPEYQIYLNRIIDIDQEGVLFINNGTHAHLYCENEMLIRSIYDTLDQNLKNATAFLKSQIPTHLNYNTHPRIGDILIMAEPGYTIRERMVPGMQYLGSGPSGAHGYDASVCQEMNTIFYAAGPNIIKGKKIAPFENIHIYPLIAKILGLKIPEIDGDISVLDSVYLNK